MSARISLPGLRADSPMGSLCAWGGLDLLSRHRDQDARLAWEESDGSLSAVIETSAAADLPELAQVLADLLRLDRLDALTDVARDLNYIMPDDLRAVLSDPDQETPSRRSDGASVRHALTGLAAEHPTRPAGQVAMSPLCIASFKGRRSLFGAVTSADDRVAVADLTQVLVGPWRYVKEAPTLGLDPAAREQDSARMGVDASNDGTRGVRGTLSLAIRGFAMIPPLPAHGRRARLACIVEHEFAWPVWAPALPAVGVRAILGRRWTKWADGHLARDQVASRVAQAHGCGVIAVYASAIISAKDGRRLAHSRLVP